VDFLRGRNRADVVLEIGKIAARFDPRNPCLASCFEQRKSAPVSSFDPQKSAFRNGARGTVIRINPRPMGIS
jgi:hypothetical protein